MAKRQKEWARRAYEALIISLGGRCRHCGATAGLSIDHIEGCDFVHNKVEWSARISIYRREAKEGKLQVLCIKCNSKKGDPRDLPDDDGQLTLFPYAPPEDGENCPF